MATDGHSLDTASLNTGSSRRARRDDVVVLPDLGHDLRIGQRVRGLDFDNTRRQRLGAAETFIELTLGLARPEDQQRVRLPEVTDDVVVVLVKMPVGFQRQRRHEVGGGGHNDRLLVVDPDAYLEIHPTPDEQPLCFRSTVQHTASITRPLCVTAQTAARDFRLRRGGLDRALDLLAVLRP